MRNAMGCLMLLALCACSPSEPDTQEVSVLRGETMGTTWEVKIVGEVPASLHKKVEEGLLQINAEMSTYIEGSQIRVFNAAGSNDVVRVGTHFQKVLAAALDWSERTGGAFDPTLDPLINAWGFGYADVPLQEPSALELQHALARCGAYWIHLEGDGIRKGHEGVELNLGAVAKGYAVDWIAEQIAEQGVENYYVEIGGEVRCGGERAGGGPWRIGIEMPMAGAQGVFRAVEIENMALATSGDYRNFRKVGDQWVAHILDPRTGKPVKHRVASVTVYAEACMDADAVATALYVMGDAEGLPWVERTEGIEALFVVREPSGSLRVLSSEGFSEILLEL